VKAGQQLRRAAGPFTLCATVAFAAALASMATGALGAGGAAPPGNALTRSNPTPLPSSSQIIGATWTSPRYDPPPNQAGDILPTLWSDDGSTYVLMDDGGVDVPVPGGVWRQSLARISGTPPHLRFHHVGDPSAPPPRTWGQIGGNRDNDDGPLGPYYSIGLAEARGIFYATQQRDWSWASNGRFTGLVGIAHSRDHGKTWRFGGKSFPAPLGNLSFVDGGGSGGAYPDGFIYAIGTEREFNASKLIVGRVRTGVANVTDPARWQWYAGIGSGTAGNRAPRWSAAPAGTRPVVAWRSHITYPQMSYDPPLGRYLLTFTYSYSPQPPAVWKSGAELVVLEASHPWGPFAFVARSPGFGPSNGYGAGFPSQWMSRNGQDLWLKWAANFAGCSRGLDCSGKYGFNVARVHLTVAKAAQRSAAHRARRSVTPDSLAGGALSLLVALVLTGAVRGARRPAGARTPRRPPELI
jgi:hypothetical protein